MMLQELHLVDEEEGTCTLHKSNTGCITNFGFVKIDKLQKLQNISLMHIHENGKACNHENLSDFVRFFFRFGPSLTDSKVN